jgi:rhodanese-related sulfurtransferase
VAFQLAKRGFDVQPLAGGLEGWMARELPLEHREFELGPKASRTSDTT